VTSTKTIARAARETVLQGRVIDLAKTGLGILTANPIATGVAALFLNRFLWKRGIYDLRESKETPGTYPGYRSAGHYSILGLFNIDRGASVWGNLNDTQAQNVSYDQMEMAETMILAAMVAWGGSGIIKDVTGLVKGLV